MRLVSQFQVGEARVRDVGTAEQQLGQVRQTPDVHEPGVSHARSAEVEHSEVVQPFKIERPAFVT